MTESGCIICLEIGDTEPERGVVITGCCKNLFHLDCIIQLYMTNKDYTCPLCRGKMDVVTPACPETSDTSSAVYNFGNSYIVDDEEEDVSSSSESEEEDVSSSSESEEEEELPPSGSLYINTDQVYIYNDPNSSSEGEEALPDPGSISIANDHIHIYCRTNSGRIYVKDILSRNPITELEISHDLPVVNGLKSMVHWSRMINFSFHIIVIYDEHHIYIYNIRNAKLIKEYRFYTNEKIQNISIGSHNGYCYIYIEIEEGDIYQRGKISYAKGQYNDTFKILECSPWISREY